MYVNEYLCITAEKDGATVSMTKGASAPTAKLCYSVDGVNWLTFTPGSTKYTLASKGDKVYFRANESNSSLSNGEAAGSNCFSISDSTTVSGKIASLINAATPASEITTDNALSYLFKDNKFLSDVTSLELPTDKLGKNCFKGLFMNCTGLTEAPELPTVSLAEGCYQEMFKGCTGISEVKVLAGDAMIKNCVKDIVADAAASGTIIRSGLSEWAVALPDGWILKDTLGRTCQKYCEFDGIGYYGCIIDTLEWAPVNCGFDPSVDADRTAKLKKYKSIVFDVQTAPFGKLYQWGRKVGGIYPYEMKNSEIYSSYTYWYTKYTDTRTFGDFSQGATITQPFITYKGVTGNRVGIYWFYHPDPGYESYEKYWPAETDPCPEGWHVPTDNDFQALFDSGHTELTVSAREIYIMNTSGNKMEKKNVYGRYYGDKSGRSIGVFLGGYGCLDYTSAGKKYSGVRVLSSKAPIQQIYTSEQTYGWFYWGNKEIWSPSNYYCHGIRIDLDQVNETNGHPYCVNAMPVRCVRTYKGN